MKYTLCFLVHLMSLFTYAQSKLGVIDDVDGFVHTTIQNDYDWVDNNYEIDFEEGTLVKTPLEASEGGVIELIYEECNCN